MLEFPTKAEFEAWLRSQPPDAIVAEEWGCATCPLAKFMIANGLAAAPYIMPSITPKSSADHSPGCWRDGPFHADVGGSNLLLLPDWADDFAHAIDDAASMRTTNETLPRTFFRAVTAAECLVALRGAA